MLNSLNTGTVYSEIFHLFPLQVLAVADLVSLHFLFAYSPKSKKKKKIS